MSPIVGFGIVRLDASILTNTPTPKPAPGTPYDTSAFVILAAVLGSVAVGIALLWLGKRAFGDPLLRQAERHSRSPGYLLSVSPTSPASTQR
jgi:hypothetical protein